jgi:hypothetical protein
LEAAPGDAHSLGVGDRVTEIQLPEVSFQALKEVFLSNDLTRTRPYRPAKESFDFVQAAQEAGASFVQSFHERMTPKGEYLRGILRDVVAFANTNGGTIFVGIGSKAGADPVGVERSAEATRVLISEIDRAVVPPIDVDVDTLTTRSKKVLRLTVRKGGNRPYSLNGLDIFIRQESETSRAMRDEIVQLIEGSQSTRAALGAQATEEAVPAPLAGADGPVGKPRIAAPRTGVEVVEVTERKGTRYYTLKDLRNGNAVSNVTRQSARRLWGYAISEYEDKPIQIEGVKWQGEIGLWKTYRRARRPRYDMVQRDGDGDLHYYYGVTEDGIHGDWAALVAAAK